MLRQLTPHGQAMHANFIVSVCANQWAMFTVEQRWDEEYITLLSRPMAVADTAAAAGSNGRVLENQTQGERKS